MKHIIKAAFITTGLGLFIMFAYSLQTPNALFDQPARTIYFILTLGTVFSALSMKRLLSFQTSSTIKYTPKQEEAKNSGLSVLVILLFIVSPMFDESGKFIICNCNWLRWIGCLFLIDAITFFGWGSWVLGKTFYSTDKKPVPLKIVSGGPYAIIRHPRYLGLMAFTLATTFVFNNYGALIISAGIIYILILKANNEETLLELEFGEDWLAYKKHTYRFFPMIY